VEFHEIQICAEEPGNDDYAGTVAARDAKSIEDRRRMQQKELGSKQCFCPQ
jgi:hypothetical protein